MTVASPEAVKRYVANPYAIKTARAYQIRLAFHCWPKMRRGSRLGLHPW
jgi:hypothetical protein